MQSAAFDPWMCNVNIYQIELHFNFRFNQHKINVFIVVRLHTNLSLSMHNKYKTSSGIIPGIIVK